MTSASQTNNSTPFVSIVTRVDSGQASHISQLISQLQQQTLSRWQLVIVEFTSPTATYISDTTSALDLSDFENENRVTLLTVATNLTDRDKCSVLLTAAAGGYICTLRIGETLHETYLEKAVLALEALPHVDVLGSHVVLADEFESHCWTPEPLSWPQIRYQPDFPMMAVIRAEALAAATTSWLELVTGTDAAELWLQLASQGSQSFIIPEPLASQPYEHPAHRSGSAPGVPSILQEIEPTSAVPAISRETIPELTDILSACAPSADLAGGSRPVILVSDLATDRMPGLLALTLARGLSAVGSPPVVIASDSTRDVTNSGPRHSALAFLEACTSLYQISHLSPTDRLKFLEAKVATLRSPLLVNIGSETCYRYLNQSADAQFFSAIVDVLWEAGASLEKHLGCQSSFTDLVVTYQDLGRLASGFGLDSKRIHEIPPAMIPTEKRQRKPLHGRRIVVGWIGDFNISAMPAFFLELAQACSDLAEFHMSGKGSMEHDIKDWAARIPFLSVSDLPRDRSSFLSEVDLLINTDGYIGLPSYGGYSTAALEALAHGVPVIAGCSGGLAELLRSTGSGVAVNPRDYAQLEVALRWLLTDLNSLEQMQQNAMAVAADDAEEHMARSYLDIAHGKLAGLGNREPKHEVEVPANTAVLLRAASAGVAHWNSQLITQIEHTDEIVTNLQSRRAAVRLLAASAVRPIRRKLSRRKARRATSTR